MKAVILAGILTLGALPVRAQTTMPLAENIGGLATASRLCSDGYRVDLDSAVKLAVSQGINPLKGTFIKIIEDTKEKLELIAGEIGIDRFCSVSFERYRPGGKVPGFMFRK